MTISVLADNHSGSYTKAEHGLSYLIDYEGIKLLFDTGQSDLFLRNAKIMGMNPHDADMIILSHGHFDHGNGLGHLSGGRLICHPGCFSARFRKHDHSYIGMKYNIDELSSRFSLQTSAGPFTIAEKIIFLGEIPRLTDFESISTPFALDNGNPDYIADDSAIALMMDEGLFVITGCGHSGIVNTLEHAKKVSRQEQIYGIMGGFHLKEADRQTTETINYLRANKVRHILPSHCTELAALSAFYAAFRIKQVRTGDIMSF
jgi:7,8-dihydropterin-6-yl-methyl-4-(beta-D-ribofuranosyl)aminobenzene 5'-phosphate synthase